MESGMSSASSLACALIIALLGAGVLAQIKATHIVVPTESDVWVCTSYDGKSRSCKPAYEVRRFLLSEARDDCGP